MTKPPGPTAEELHRYADRFNRSETLKLFGFRIEFPTTDRVLVLLDPIRPEHRGGLGSDAVNGGVLAACFDLVIGCTPALIDPTRRNATMQLSMSFERPLRGARLVGEGRVDRAGRDTLFSSARLLDERGEEVGRCQGLVKLSGQRWADGGSPAVN